MKEKKMLWDLLNKETQKNLLAILIDQILDKKASISDENQTSEKDQKASSFFNAIQKKVNLENLLFKVCICEVHGISKKNSVFYINKNCEVLEKNEVDFNKPIALISIFNFRRNSGILTFLKSEKLDQRIDFTIYIGIEFPNILENPDFLIGTYGGGLKSHWKLEHSKWQRISPFSFLKSEVREDVREQRVP